MNIKKFLNAISRALIEEAKEIKGLEVTEEDKEQAEQLTGLVIATLGAYGVALLPLEPVLKKALAYGIRDIKDGTKTPDKLIISRIKKELSKES